MPTAAQRRTNDYITDDSFLDDEDNYSPDREDVRASRSSAIQSGWEAALKSASADKSYTSDFKWSEEDYLVKFLDSEPIAVYDQHWIDRPGKKSWTCLGKGCPICEIGDKPKRKIAFAIVNLGPRPKKNESPDFEPVAEVLTVSQKTAQIMNRHHNDEVTGPLDRMYYRLSKTGTGPQTVFSVVPVKTRDLDEDWGRNPADTESLIQSFEPLDASVISSSPRSALEEIAEEITARAPRR